MQTDLSMHASLPINGSISILLRWNQLDPAAAASEVLPCCGSRVWSQQLAQARPLATAAALLHQSDEVWRQLSPSDWEEAFMTHPRIGAPAAPEIATAQSSNWSQQEQGSVASSTTRIKQQLAAANAVYEQCFGRTFIVCATGKSAAEILVILEQRLTNDPVAELAEAVEQQRLITRLRLQKWLRL